jgi:hypothetical protein
MILRNALYERVDEMKAKFIDIGAYRFSNTNETWVDPTMYRGSAGVLYALFKYILLLRKEEVGMSKLGYGALPSLAETESQFKAALEVNLDFMCEDSRPDVSFLASGFVGLSTLSILYMLEDDYENEIDWKNILGMVDSFMLGVENRKKHNDKHKGVDFGTVGYLYALLTLDAKVTEKRGEYKD